MDGESEPVQANTRWWESYLVRYFLGFIVGALCVAVIADQAGLLAKLQPMLEGAAKSPDGDGKLGMTSTAIAIGLCGVAYCYLASTPITVLHTGRAIHSVADGLSRYFWLGWALALLITLSPLHGWASALKTPHFKTFAALTLVIVSVAAIRHRSQPPPNNEPFYFVFFVAAFAAVILATAQAVARSHPVTGAAASAENVRLLVMGAPVIWIGVAQYFVLFGMLCDERKGADTSAIFKFYKDLFKARRSKGAQDVRDTYTHLREHSNAIFIVAVEIGLLALVLGLLRIDRSANTSTAMTMDHASLVLAALGIWMVPTIFMWSRANALEKHFAEKGFTVDEKGLTSPATSSPTSSH